ncbi:MAG: DUF1330 domain-containing protein [Actinomycetota bacterium]
MIKETKPAYGMVQIYARNPDEFLERYAQHVHPMMKAWGVEMIAGTTTPRTMDGSFNGNWAAVLRFPSMEVAEAWYNSADYEPFKNLRINELTDFGNVVFLEGC